ncbi:hypothetical protein KRM28CT15_63730 [Krasilnikovia sp. M28-CT-15]
MALVVVAEDEDDIRALVVRMLHRAGHEVIEAPPRVSRSRADPAGAYWSWPLPSRKIRSSSWSGRYDASPSARASRSSQAFVSC